MNFDEWNADTKQGVTQGNAGVGKGAWVDDDESGPIVTGSMNGIHQFMLRIALYRPQVVPTLARTRLKPPIDVLEAVMAVDLRFTRTEQIQIRAVQDNNPGHRAHRLRLGPDILPESCGS